MPLDHDTHTIVARLRDAATEEGFLRFGIAPAVDAAGFTDLVRWIDAGYAAEMQYFAGRKEAYRHPRGVLEGVRSIIMLAYPYASATPEEVAGGFGRVARYAWSGADYHDVVHPKLKRLCGIIREERPAAGARGVIDTAPLLEREYAQLAGLGWRGKNTLLLNKSLGSYFFLACVLTDLDLPLDDPHTHSHCGTCTACLDACPTDAFPQAGVLDASRCISYLTIEHRGSVPIELRDGIGDWLFGCDICQEVCPWNRKPSRDAEIDPGASHAIELLSLFSYSDEDFRDRFRRSPLWRPRRRGLLRNAAIVLGNQASLEARPALSLASKDADPVVREAAQWALSKLDDA